VTNSQVIRAWSNGQPAHSAHLSTDGDKLFSYALCIGEWRDGLPVVFNYTARADINPFGHRVPSLGFYSQTTSHHVSLARRVGYAFDKDNPPTACSCCDPGCPIGHKGDCRSTATTWLSRVDDIAREPLPFCDACADDAYASGVFANAEGAAS